MKKAFSTTVLILAFALLLCLSGCPSPNGNGGEIVTLTGISLDTTAVKKEFTVGEEFSSEKLVVTAVYSDNSKKQITDFRAEGFDSSKSAESQTITISYTENGKTVTATYTVVIKEKPAEENPPAEEKCEITYKTEFGSVNSKKVEKGYILTAADLPSLTKSGYIFAGWNKNAGDVINSATTITASWKKIDSAFDVTVDSVSTLKMSYTVVRDDQIKFEVPAGYKTYQWYVDGILDTEAKTSEYIIETRLPYGSKAREALLPEFEYENGIHEILVVVTAADGTKDSAKAKFVIEN